MKLSIIIPVFNVEKYLERCLLSVIDQDISKEEYEIILINDGSTDRSGEIANRFRDNYPNITLLTQENKGQGAARNKGLSVAKGDYIAFVDADDYVTPHSFDKMLKECLAMNLDILVAHSKFMNEDGSFCQVNKPSFVFCIIYTGEEVLLKGYRPTSVWAKLFRRDLVIKTVGGFVEGIIHEDVDFDMKLFPLAERVMFMDICCYVYYWNSQSTDRYMNYEKILRSLTSDVIIAGDLKSYSRKAHLKNETKALFQRHTNSMIVSLCYSLLTKNRKLAYSDKMGIINQMIKLGLLPMKGKTNSKKSDKFGYLLRFPFLLKTAIRLISYH